MVCDDVDWLLWILNDILDFLWIESGIVLFNWCEVVVLVLLEDMVWEMKVIMDVVN